MVDDIDPDYLKSVSSKEIYKDFQNRVNSNPIVQDNDGVLISATFVKFIKAFGIVGVILCLASIFFCYSIYYGDFKPVFIDNSTCVSSNLSDLKIPSCPICPSFSCPVVVIDNSTFSNSQNLNYSFVEGNLNFNGTIYYLNQTLTNYILENCTNVTN